ncbi:MAG: hypothetical protein AAF402_03620 [Pseudomonadota bacterium]
MKNFALMISVALFSVSPAIAGNDNEKEFNKLDVDNSGSISAEEAVAMEGLQESMNDYDLNGDRELDMNEFTLFVETMAAKAASQAS